MSKAKPATGGDLVAAAPHPMLTAMATFAGALAAVARYPHHPTPNSLVTALDDAVAAVANAAAMPLSGGSEGVDMDALTLTVGRLVEEQLGGVADRPLAAVKECRDTVEALTQAVEKLQSDRATVSSVDALTNDLDARFKPLETAVAKLEGDHVPAEVFEVRTRDLNSRVDELEKAAMAPGENSAA